MVSLVQLDRSQMIPLRTMVPEQKHDRAGPSLKLQQASRQEGCGRIMGASGPTGCPDVPFIHAVAMAAREVRSSARRSAMVDPRFAVS